MEDIICEKFVEHIKPGEYVKRKPDAKKVYKRGSYIPGKNPGFMLLDCDDISFGLVVRKGTKLYVGFTY